MSFPLDDPQAALTFTARLARENGWSHAFARRVIGEYRRFAFLAMEAGHPVAPSDEVDQAWHLHLTYTRSYWHDFCALLGRPLHHQPTRGGPDELRKHLDWYEQTLTSYRRLFESDPPADIWPSAEVRFRLGAGRRRVDLERCWVIPKPGWRELQTATLMAGGLAPLAALAGPFDLDGPHFLLLYALLSVVALAAACVLRSILRRGAASENRDLEIYEVACLAGGNQQAIRAAAAALVQQGVLEVRREETKMLGFLPGASRYYFAACQPPRPGAAELERAVYRAAQCQKQTMEQLLRAANDEAARLAARLEEAGLRLSAGQASKVRWGPALIMLGLASFGAAKVAIGISRGKPVVFLILAVLATLVVVAMFLKQSIRSRLGDRVLKQLVQRHASLKRSDYADVPAEHVALAVGLFGPAILLGGPLADLRHALGAPPPEQSGGGCGSGCSGCGGGGCGGGCGGCGGCN